MTFEICYRNIMYEQVLEVPYSNLYQVLRSCEKTKGYISGAGKAAG